MTRISESHVAEAVIKELLRIDPTLKIRRELPIIHPTEGLVSIDIVACKTEPDGNRFSVIECKRRLNTELVGQILRWVGLANRRYVAHLAPKRASRIFRERRNSLDFSGIGRFTLLNDFTISSSVAKYKASADTRLLSAAFYAHDGSLDPAAGSSSARRMDQSRTQWEPLRVWLKRTPEEAHTWATIRRSIAEMRAFTCANAVKAIDKNELLGVEYESIGGVRYFMVKEGK